MGVARARTVVGAVREPPLPVGYVMRALPAALDYEDGRGYAGQDQEQHYD